MNESQGNINELCLTELIAVITAESPHPTQGQGEGEDGRNKKQFST